MKRGSRAKPKNSWTYHTRPERLHELAHEGSICAYGLVEIEFYAGRSSSLFGRVPPRYNVYSRVSGVGEPQSQPRQHWEEMESKGWLLFKTRATTGGMTGNQQQEIWFRTTSGRRVSTEDIRIAQAEDMYVEYYEKAVKHSEGYVEVWTSDKPRGEVLHNDRELASLVNEIRSQGKWLWHKTEETTPSRLGFEARDVKILTQQRSEFDPLAPVTLHTYVRFLPFRLMRDLIFLMELPFSPELYAEAEEKLD